VAKFKNRRASWFQRIDGKSSGGSLDRRGGGIVVFVVIPAGCRISTDFT